MTKAQILDAIRRMASSNGGKAPGSQRFQSETGLGKSGWYPKLWLRWGDAVREAGCEPNVLSASYDEDLLIRKYIELTLELGRFPIEGDLMVKRKRDKAFPDRDSFWRLGNKAERIAKVLAYCRTNVGCEEVTPLVAAAAATAKTRTDEVGQESASLGYVYLIRHGARHEYKIGRTNNQIRREGEIGIQLPEAPVPVHVIETDDPAGIETYWHRRFADRRLNGEWFSLTAEDVRAFKRWKKIF
jgi:hypothetical protein